MATNYDINYNDSRFKEVEADKQAALNEVDVTYGNMISKSDQYFDKQIQASKDWADKQTELQNQQTEQTIKEINQQKEQAQKDYTKEQSGAYVDWQKQSNQYGANAEQMAAQGLAGSGYSESSQVSMYNTYQNRVATAREAFVLAKQNYDNAISKAQIANSSALAEIAYEAYQKQIELSLQGFQYKNQLLLDKANKKTEVETNYYNRYQDVLTQINRENALAEEVRQYNATLAQQQAKLDEQKRQHEVEMAYKNAALAEEKRQFDALHPAGGSGTISGGSGGSGGGSTTKGKSTAQLKKDNAKKSNGAKVNEQAATKDDAEAYINALIKSGATKDTVANEISLALRKGAITKDQAARLRSKFTPRGVQY